MPIYEYACDACGHELEALQSISDEPLADCPECGKPALRKRISASAFRLKGGGWYETDFKTNNKRNLAGESSASESKKPDKTAKSDTTGKGEKKADKSGGASKKAAAEG